MQWGYQPILCKLIVFVSIGIMWCMFIRDNTFDMGQICPEKNIVSENSQCL